MQINLFHEVINHIQRKACNKRVKNYWYCRVSSSRKMQKNHPMVPPLETFQGKNKNHSSFARTISMSRRSFFENLMTFERRSGLKKFPLLKIAILKMGWLSKFQSHRSWGDAHLSLGRFRCSKKQDEHFLRTYDFDIFKIAILRRGKLFSPEHRSKVFKFAKKLLSWATDRFGKR